MDNPRSGLGGGGLCLSADQKIEEPNCGVIGRCLGDNFHSSAWIMTVDLIEEVTAVTPESTFHRLAVCFRGQWRHAQRAAIRDCR